MVATIFKIITSFVMPVSGLLAIKNLLGIDRLNNRIKIVFLILLLATINYLQYNSSYQSFNIILNFISMVICYKLIFKIGIFKSFLLSIILMLFVSLSDMITYLIMSPVFGMNTVRKAGFVMLASNLMVGLFTVLLSYFKFIKTIFDKLVKKLESKPTFQIVIIAFLWVVVISCICYFVIHKSNSPDFYISAVVETIFIIFLIVYFKEKNQNALLNERFDSLFDYIQTIEDIIESEQLNIHEFKNQLTVIRGMSNNKKINDYIDSIVEVKDLGIESNSDLAKLPKGGLKGLLYYKCAIAKKKKLNLFVNISKNSCNSLKNISVENVKILSKLLGVYLDNAIEASEVSEGKNLSIEIYNKLDKVNIVISNTVVKGLDISKFNKKGYSTKEKGRGKGLYLVTKTLKNNSNFQVSSNIINDFYVQRIVIND